jgi:thiamine-phosphate pyrophosphorylase
MWRAPPGHLHVITDTALQSRFSAEEIARLAAEGGADVIQFREKAPRTTDSLQTTARAVVKASAAYGAASIVNDRADVALAAGAAGVHLGRQDLHPSNARRILGPTAWIGATANSLAEAKAHLDSPIDYLGVGPVYGTYSKEKASAPMGTSILREIVQASEVPVIAIGGILPEHIPALFSAGVHGVAVLSGVTCAADPGEAAFRYAEAIRSCLGERE